MSKELTVKKPLWECLTEISGAIEKEFPDHAQLIRQVAKQDIVALGQNEIFTLRDGQGEIRAFKQALTFSLSAGTLVQPVPGGPLVVSAQGYEVWQECAGASVIFPKEIGPGRGEMGTESRNRQRSGKSETCLCIYARAVAFRFSSKGIPMVTDHSTIFDTPSYRLIDLLGKAKKFPQSFRLLPNDMKKPEDSGTWACYPFDESTSLWVNTSHDEALTWFAQILNREKKALDFAQTFARRNALKHLSGIQKAPADNWTVSVICWRPTSGNIVKWDATQYANLREVAGNLITSRGEEFGSTDQICIECNVGAERVSDDPGTEENEKIIDPEDQAPPEGETKPQEAAAHPKKVQANFDESRVQFPDEFTAACRQLRLNPEGQHTAEQMVSIMNLVGKMLE